MCENLKTIGFITLTIKNIIILTIHFKFSPSITILLLINYSAFQFNQSAFKFLILIIIDLLHKL